VGAPTSRVFFHSWKGEKGWKGNIFEDLNQFTSLNFGIHIEECEQLLTSSSRSTFLYNKVLIAFISKFIFYDFVQLSLPQLVPWGDPTSTTPS